MLFLSTGHSVGSGEGRSAEEITPIICFGGKNLRMGDMEQDTHNERERDRHKEVYLY